MNPIAINPGRGRRCRGGCLHHQKAQPLNWGSAPMFHTAHAVRMTGGRVGQIIQAPDLSMHFGLRYLSTQRERTVDK